MALVRKGSRPITVDGVVYRWRVRRRPGPAAGPAAPLSFAVEQVDAHGAVLLVTMPAAPAGTPVPGPTPSVLPSTVAAAIRVARTGGWRPERGGPAVQLRLTAADVPVAPPTPHDEPPESNSSE